MVAALAFVLCAPLAACASGSNDESESLPAGVIMTRDEAESYARSLERGHDIDDVDIRLVPFADVERVLSAWADVPRDGGPVGGQGPSESDLVWAVGFTGDFFDEHRDRYRAVVYVVDNRSHAFGPIIRATSLSPQLPKRLIALPDASRRNS